METRQFQQQRFCPPNLPAREEIEEIDGETDDEEEEEEEGEGERGEKGEVDLEEDEKEEGEEWGLIFFTEYWSLKIKKNLKCDNIHKDRNWHFIANVG